MPLTPQDYASCNGFGRGGAPYAPGPPDPLEWQNYTCLCDNWIDRTFAHQSAAPLCAICGAFAETACIIMVADRFK